MSTLNPFDLLDNDAEDLSQLAKAKPVKVEKPAPVQPAKSSQAVREVKNGGYEGRGGDRRGRVGEADADGYVRVRGNGYIREPRSNGAPPANGNRNGGGGYRRSQEGDGGARRGGGVGGNRSGERRVSFSNGDADGIERPRRNYERHSGNGHGNEVKRDGAGRGGETNGDSDGRPRRHYERRSGTGQRNEFKRDGAGSGNLGEAKEEVTPVIEVATEVAEKELAVEKEGVEGEAADAKKEAPVNERVPEMKVIGLEEYEKVLEEKKKALQTSKTDERKVDTKVFEAMQQLSSKKSNNDDVFIKLGTEKDKRVTEREEKAKKSVSINEFLKPVNGRGGVRGGKGRGGPRGGAAVGGRGSSEEAAAEGGNQRYSGAAAPAIEDTAQFPTLGGK